MWRFPQRLALNRLRPPLRRNLIADIRRAVFPDQLRMTNTQCVATESKKLLLTDTQSRTGQQARLTLPDGRMFDLDIMKPTLGDAVVCDVRTLYNSGKVLFYDPGLNSVASCASAVTHTDGDRGICLYRGYSVPELLEKHDYLTVAYLLLYGQLPLKTERSEFEDRIKAEMLIHTRLKEFITTFVPGAHPMSILASVLSAMASFYADPMDPAHMTDEAVRDLACIRLIAKIPTVVAMTYKVLIGEPMVYPREDLTFAENFLHMMFARPTGPYEINPLHAEIIDCFLSIHADHEQNASTSTVRTAGSSLANPYACIATGVTSLWGRAHGGANEAVVDMLTRIGSVDRVPEFIDQVKKKEVRLMGFGHRVYKNYDPRAKIMQTLCRRLFKEMNEYIDPLFDIAKALEAHALSDPYFVERKLYPNVDFYSGIVMRALGIPKEMFTVMFAMGRSIGWLSHWREMVEECQIKITRPRQLYLGHNLRDLTTPYHHYQNNDNDQIPSKKATSRRRHAAGAVNIATLPSSSSPINSQSREYSDATPSNFGAAASSIEAASGGILHSALNQSSLTDATLHI